MLLISCGKEKLTPLYQPLTINEVRNNKPLNFSYQINTSKVDEYGKIAEKIPLFGKLFQAIAIVLANTTINDTEGYELKLPTLDVDLSRMADIDFNLIEFINFNSLFISITNPKGKDSLTFISILELYAKLENPIEGLPTDAEGYSKLVHFDKDGDGFQCDGTCIKLNIAKIDWKTVLKTNKIIYLRPRLIITSVPKSTMKLTETIDFSIKFNFGF